MSEKSLDESYLVKVEKKGVVVKRRYNDRDQALEAAMSLPEEENPTVAEETTGRTLRLEKRGKESKGTPDPHPLPTPKPPRRRGRAFLLVGILALLLMAPLALLLFTGGNITRDETYASPVGTPKVTITATRVKKEKVSSEPHPVAESDALIEGGSEKGIQGRPLAGGIAEILNAASPAGPDSFPFTVHAGSFKKAERAARQVDLIREKGESAFSCYVEIAGMGGWYRVFVGSFATREEAMACQQRIKAMKVGDSSVVRKNVAIAVEEPLEKEAALSLERKLHDKGFFAYTLPALRTDEKIQVMVGAFQKEGRAEEMIAMLEEEGFEEHMVIKR